MVCTAVVRRLRIGRFRVLSLCTMGSSGSVEDVVVVVRKEVGL